MSKLSPDSSQHRFGSFVEAADLPAAFANFHDTYPSVYVIVSPPRGSSTAFARVLWQHPSISYYSHEPFEVTYYMGQGLEEVAGILDHPLNLREFIDKSANTDSNNLVIKEMPYQVNRKFPLLVALATAPVIFLIRDPRLNIASRIAKKQEAGDDIFYPKIESGWDLLSSQIRWCKVHHVPHFIIDATDFRNYPDRIFPVVFEKLGLSFSTKMLKWQPLENVEIDNLHGKHRHLYKRVLESDGLQPAIESVPTLDSFPIANDFRQHVANCIEIYSALREDEARILPTE